MMFRTRHKLDPRKIILINPENRKPEEWFKDSADNHSNSHDLGYYLKKLLKKIENILEQINVLKHKEEERALYRELKHVKILDNGVEIYFLDYIDYLKKNVKILIDEISDEEKILHVTELYKNCYERYKDTYKNVENIFNAIKEKVKLEEVRADLSKDSCTYFYGTNKLNLNLNRLIKNSYFISKLKELNLTFEEFSEDFKKLTNELRTPLNKWKTELESFEISVNKNLEIIFNIVDPQTGCNLRNEKPSIYLIECSKNLYELQFEYDNLTKLLSPDTLTNFTRDLLNEISKLLKRIAKNSKLLQDDPDILKIRNFLKELESKLKNPIEYSFKPTYSNLKEVKKSIEYFSETYYEKSSSSYCTTIFRGKEKPSQLQVESNMETNYSSKRI